MLTKFLRASTPKGFKVPSFITSDSASTGTGNNYTLSFGTSATVGDLIVICCATSSSSIPERDIGVATSGYTELFQQYYDAGVETTFSVSYKIATGGENSATIIGSGSSNRGAAATVHIWRNIDQSTPFDVMYQTATASSAKPNPPSITPITENAVVMGGGATSASSLTGTYNNSSLSGVESQIGNGSSNDVCIAMGYDESWTSGAVDLSGYSGGNTGTTISCSLVLRPAPL